MEISVCRSLRAPEQLRVYEVQALLEADVARHRGFRVTSPARTLVDLCARENPADVRSSVEDFLRRRRLTLARLEETVGRHRRHRGIHVLKELLGAYLHGEVATES